MNKKRTTKQVKVKPTWIEKHDMMDAYNVSADWIEARAVEGALVVSIYERKCFINVGSIEKMMRDNIVLPDELKSEYGWRNKKEPAYPKEFAQFCETAGIV